MDTLFLVQQLYSLRVLNLSNTCYLTYLHVQVNFYNYII